MFKSTDLNKLKVSVSAAAVIWLLALSSVVNATPSITFTDQSQQLTYLEQSYFSPHYVESAATKQERIDDLELQLQWAQQQQWDDAERRAALALTRQYASAENLNRVAELTQRYPHQYNRDTITDLLIIDLTLAYMEHNDAKVEQLISLARRYKPELSPYRQAQIDLHIGIALTMTDRSIDALNRLEQALQIFEQVGDVYSVDSVLNIVASVHSEQGAYEQSRQIYRDLLSRSIENGDQLSTSIFQYNIGITHSEQRQYSLAESMYQQALQASKKLDDEVGIAFAHMMLAITQISQHQYLQALEHTKQALQFLNPEQMRSPYLAVLSSQVEIYLALDQLDNAEQAYQALLELMAGATSETQRHDFIKLSAMLAFKRGNYQQAIAIYQDFGAAKRAHFETKKLANSEQQLLELQRRQALRTQQQDEQQQDDHHQAMSRTERHHLALFGVIFLTLFTCVGLGYFCRRESKNSQVLAQSARRDHLTKAPNRRAIMEQFELAIEHAQQSQQPLTIALIDLDYFKRINDSFGHEQGDRVLQEFARTCERHLREGDSFGRIGGEEWLVLMPATELATAAAVFSRLQQPWLAQNMLPHQASTPMTFSMGAAQLQPHMTLCQLMKQADRALFQAKNEGRNRLVLAPLMAPLAEVS